METETALKPCPFCGPGASRVTCGRCGSHSGKIRNSEPEPPIRLSPSGTPAIEANDARRDVFSLPDGRYVVISWPQAVSAEECHDIAEWFRLIERRLTRAWCRMKEEERQSAVNADGDAEQLIKSTP